jgi:glycine hydroxymethyltransferase
MKEDDMREVAHLIDEVLKNTKPASSDGKASPAKYEIDAEFAEKMRIKVSELLTRFPLYPTINL